MEIGEVRVGAVAAVQNAAAAEAGYLRAGGLFIILGRIRTPAVQSFEGDYRRILPRQGGEGWRCL